MTQMKLTFCKGKLLFKEGKEYPPPPPGNVTIEMGLLKKNRGYKFQQIRSDESFLCKIQFLLNNGFPGYLPCC